MSHKLLTLHVRGLNSSRKRRQVFRWLHLQRSDIIFLQETYSSTETIKRWEAEWGGKVVASHGTTHSEGVMILFKPNLNVTINKTLADKNVKLSMFQYKIIHNILCTKSLLFKMKKEDSPRCPFCPADHTIIHLFTECAQATLFWKEFLDWASRKIIAFNKRNYVWHY